MISNSRKHNDSIQPLAVEKRDPGAEPARRSIPRLALLLVVLGGLASTAPFLLSRLSASSKAEAHLYRGQEFVQQGRPQEAEQEWLEAERVAPGNPNVYHALGSLYMAQLRFKDARRVFNRLSDIAPSEPHTLCSLARMELRARMTDTLEYAAQDSARAAALEPGCIQAQTVAGDSWIQMGDTRRGLEYLRRACALNPADVPLRLHTIQALLDANLRDEVASMTEDLTRRYPGFAQGYALLGLIYQLYPPGSRQASSVEDTLLHSLHLDPTNSLAQSEMGHLMLRLGRPSEAVKHLESARFLNPKKTSTLFDLVRAYRGIGRTATADSLDREFQRRSAMENELGALEKQYTLASYDPKFLPRLVELATALGDERSLQFYRRHQAARAIESGENQRGVR